MGSTAFAKEQKANAFSEGVSEYAGDDPEWYRANGIGIKEQNKDQSIKSMSDNISGYRHNPRFGSAYDVKTGIDVSKFQGTINWSSAKADGVQFAFIRAGFRGYEAGTLNTDPCFATNISGATAAGIPVGVYFFSQAINPAEAEAEANYLMNLIGGYHISLPLVIDFEYVNTGSGNIGRLYNAHLSVTEATAVCTTFCRTVESRGYKGMVYANNNMLSYNLNASNISPYYQVWLANYVYETSYTGDYNFWQFRSNGRVAGISGNVDVDFWYDKKAGFYDIIFDGNGATSGSMTPMKQCDPTRYYDLRPNKFKRKGFEYKNWNTKKNGTGTPYKNKTLVINLGKDGKSQVTLYAQWKIINYEIQYKLDGGVNNKKNPSKYNIQTDKITLYDAQKPGYIFKGWYSDKSFTDRVKTIKKGTTGNIKLYAKFVPIKYTVKYDGNGAQSGSVNSASCTYGKEYTTKNNRFVNKGYTFSGWNTKKSGLGTMFEEGATFKNLTTKSDGTVTLYAIWKAKNYSINYYLNGGINASGNPTKYTVNDEIILQKPTRKGYTFQGWYKEKSFKTKVAKIAKGSTGNVTLYAKWKANQYTIIFDGNGADDGEMNAMLCQYDKAYVLLNNQFTKEGYRFIGWNTKADGTGKAYEEGSEIKNLKSSNLASMTLYAQWEEITDPTDPIGPEDPEDDL